ncbi:trihelix mRNAion factor GTL1-like isoform X1 [Huso huso]|uniref:Trihelix mRNAion factor GTL1-like isoform X1 n=1 Tax=Huso huso TaxID=61971 RepID=A0ABR0YLM7_HUSHU
MEAMVDPPAEKEGVVQEDELDSSSNWTETPSSAGTLHRTTTGKKRKRVDAPAPVLELVKVMRESDTKYMDFIQVQMQAERDFRERQMALDREQREREREASTTLNTQLISVLGRIGEALLTRNAKDIPVD